MNKTLNIIVCCDKKMGIGVDNKLPWNISSEMRLFKEKTIGNGNNCVIMGKNTYLSIPDKYFPLSNRYNCIVSKNIAEFQNDTNCKILKNLNEDLLMFLNNSDYDIYWIIGGSSIYYEIMTHYPQIINEIHISIINHDYKCNKFFPIIHDSQFILKDKVENKEDNYNHYVYKNNAKIHI